MINEFQRKKFHKSITYSHEIDSGGEKSWKEG